MGPGNVDYYTVGSFIGAFVGALLFTGIVVALSRSIRASLPKLFATTADLAVLSIIASYYGNADGAPVDFPPPLEQFLGFEAALRLASFGAAFLVFSIPVLAGYWKDPKEGEAVYGASNLRMSKWAIPIAFGAFVPLALSLYQNDAPQGGLQAYETIAPKTMTLLDELKPQFREKTAEVLEANRYVNNTGKPDTQAELVAEVGVVAAQVQKLKKGRAEVALLAPADVQGEVLRSLADGLEWFAQNEPSLCVDFMMQGWQPFADRFAPESLSLVDN